MKLLRILVVVWATPALLALAFGSLLAFVAVIEGVWKWALK